MDHQRLVTEAAAQLAAETVRLDGIQREVIACPGPIPEALQDDLEHARERHQQAVGLVLRLSNP
jgi:hypothetical protein